ncbi:MAG: radical SAM protein [archaeon]|nr:radical SAM protein [archaeon]
MVRTIFDKFNFRRKYDLNIIRCFFTGIDNLLNYIFLKKPKRGPLYLGWDITFRCNFRCKYCNYWKLGMKTKDELDTDECFNIIKQAGKAGVCILTITGGEPLLRDDIGILIVEAKKYGMSVNINTNGSLLEKKVELLVNSGLDSITISVESHKAQVHDYIRGFEGSFDLLQKGIEELKKVRKSKKPRIIIRAAVSGTNYNELEEFIEYWKTKVDEIIFQPIHEGSIFHISEKQLKISKEDKKRFTLCFDRLIKKYEWLRNTYYKEFPAFFFNTKHLMTRYKCFCAFFSLKIDPYGNAYACPEFIQRLGNLREKSFNEIWRDKRIQEFREMLKRKENKCFCWYYCTGPVNCFLTKICNVINI